VGAVAVALLLPDGLLAKAREVRSATTAYEQLRQLKNPIKGSYLMLFLMVTLLILFAAIWVGVTLARGITVPIQRLAEATRAVAAGRLDVRVDAKAASTGWSPSGRWWAGSRARGATPGTRRCRSSGTAGRCTCWPA